MPQIRRALHLRSREAAIFQPSSDLAESSAVLLLFGRCGQPGPGPNEIGLILNKRSRRVRQPGDLCCPGGSILPRFDFRAARILGLPPLPLGLWPYWRAWRRERPAEARWLARYFATALREAYEEMRLNPLRVRFLGPLPPHRLVMFQRLIYPLAAWVAGRPRLAPNWEVERIVKLPLRVLLDHGHYVRYHLTLSLPSGEAGPEARREMPAFRFRNVDGEEELLWGATYRIIMDLLNSVFGFIAPLAESRPVVSGRLRGSYRTGEKE